MIRPLALLLALAALPAPTQDPVPAEIEVARDALGAPAGAALSGDALDAEAERVSGLLRCPVCQGLSVADSPVDLAQNMRQQVRELLAEGYTEEQILGYFESAYGEFVLLEPKLEGVNWLVWLAPLAGLLAGGAVVYWTLRRGPGASAPQEPSPAPAAPARDTLPDDPELARYVERVRELAYGWPGGVPPARSTEEA